MKLTEFQKNVLRYIGIRFAGFAVNALLKSLRIRTVNGEKIRELKSANRNFIAVFWHGSMMLGWYILRDSGCTALVSKSKDGDVLAHILGKWNYRVVRGSSHVGGKEALELMVSLTNNNESIVITPDGPTGPYHVMKAGAVVTSKKTGAPLFLVGIGMKKKWMLKSWDSFEIPKPFSRVTVKYSDPVYIEPDIEYDETGKFIAENQSALNRVQKEALELC